MKIIISERQQKLIKENDIKDSLIDMIKDGDWKSTAELVSGVENLKKLTGIETPMEFLNLFSDMDVVQSEEEPNWTLFRYEKGNNMMIHDRKNNGFYVNYFGVWDFLEEGFDLDYIEIQDLMKEWLFESYNLRWVAPGEFWSEYYLTVV